jgi:Na+/citrate or Na+/malate symporter
MDLFLDYPLSSLFVIAIVVMTVVMLARRFPSKLGSALGLVAMLGAVCSNCGNKLRRGAAFCPRCGQKVG